MDKKSQTLTILFVTVVVVAVVLTFYKYVVLEDIDFYTDEESFQEELIYYFEGE